MSCVFRYSPVGATTVRLLPTMTLRGDTMKARAPIAGLPVRLIENLARMSTMPVRVRLRACSPTSPLTLACETGSAAVISARRPNRPKVYPAASGTALMLASMLLTGSVGSVSTPPVERDSPATRKNAPSGLAA
jgi:hypothetical protein